SLTLFATDDGDGGGRWAKLETSYTFVLTVQSENDPPVLEYIGKKIAVVGEPLVVQLRASDKDQEPLHFSVTGLPAGATITPGAVYGTATLTWTPQGNELGSYSAVVTVTDEGHGTGTPASDDEAVIVTVRNSNTAPVLADVPDKIVKEGERLTF